MASAEAATGGKLVLKLHNYRKQWKGRSGVTHEDLTYEFLFSVSSSSGQKLESFWTEVQLKDALRNREGWKNLSEIDTIKALYAFAVECISKGGGRAMRHLVLNWVAGTPYAESPCWDLFKINIDSNPTAEIDPAEAVDHVVVHQK